MGTGGGENLDDNADSKLQKIADSNLTNRASRELVEVLMMKTRYSTRSQTMTCVSPTLIARLLS